MTNNLQVFTNEKFGKMRVINKNGNPWFVANDVCSILDIDTSTSVNGRYRKDKDGNSYKDGGLDDDEKDTDIVSTHGGDQEMIIISEPGLYSLILKSRKPEAKEYKRWVTHVVLPTIRKTGGFVADEEQFIDTYLPFADDHIKLLFKSTLAIVNSQNKLIEEQKIDIGHKGDIIKGLIDDMTLADKRQILNRVVMKCSNFHDRWKELYKTYELKNHLSLDARLNSYNKTHTPQLRNKLEYIEVIGKIDELFSIACKLYESEVNVLVEEMYRLHEVELVQ